MSNNDPLLLTQSGNNWTNLLVSGSLVTDSDGEVGYTFYSGTWPSYIYNGSFSAQYTDLVDATNATFPPANVTSSQQSLINYYLSDTSGSVGGFADVQYRVSFSDVSNILFHEDTGAQTGQIFISNADISLSDDPAGTTFKKVTSDTYSGTTAGTNFTLSFAPPSIDNVEVFVSGVLQSQSTYSVSGTALTFNTAQIPNTVTINISNEFAGDIVLNNDAVNGSTMQGQLAVGQQ